MENRMTNRLTVDDELTFKDVFCGAGGSSAGLAAAGLKLKLAANHWDRAIETHSANFPDAEHLCADVSNYDWRRAPRTHVAWFSPECTWHSPAGGRKRVRAQLDLFPEYVPTDGGIRSRATMLDVIRATEVHQYPVVIVENVVEVVSWELFDWWYTGMESLGYTGQTINVSAAHVGAVDNDPAAQWRDRVYFFFTRKGLTVPDVRPRPIAMCPSCGDVVQAVQAWKDTKVTRRRKVGKYRTQYVYVCPEPRCKNQTVEPYVLPSAAILDLDDVGTRIGDRKRPLAAATMRRVGVGIEMFWAPVAVAAAGNTWDSASPGHPGFGNPDSYVRAYPVQSDPLTARTATAGDGIAFPPFMLERRDYDGADQSRLTSTSEPMRPVTATGRAVHGVVTSPIVTTLRRNGGTEQSSEPLATISAGGNHHGITHPPGAFISKHHGGVDYPRPEHMNKSVGEPLPALVARTNMSLVIPYRRGAKPKMTSEPLHAMSTHDSAAIVKPAIDIEDCYFRMIKPREQLRAQRFYDSYIVTGNKSEQTMQAGNAVPSNVAQWLGGIAIEVLAG
jgi:DNA (cytosine-5)-methyltransferase 1